MSEKNDLFIKGLVSLISEIESADAKLPAAPELAEKVLLNKKKHTEVLENKNLIRLPGSETAILAMKEALDKMPFFIDNPHSSKIFSLPTLPVMFTLLPLFTGKPVKSPKGLKQILSKPDNERTEEEKEFLKESIFEKVMVTEEAEKTSQAVLKRKNFTVFICDSPIVQATANLDPNINVEEETLSGYVNRVFGAEGMRHIMALLAGLEEHGRDGKLRLNINEHLGRMGYKKEKSGSYNSRLKLVASDIIRILSGLSITSVKEMSKNIRITSKRLFTLVQSDVKLDINKDIIDGFFEIRAEDWWYKDAFTAVDIEIPSYCKLLKDIILEDHSQHAITISLMPVLATFWRKSPEPEFTVKRLMDWCNLDYSTPKDGGDRHRLDRLKQLEAELDYMKTRGYIKNWLCNKAAKPSMTAEPFECMIRIMVPKWYENKILEIDTRREVRPKTSGRQQLTREEFLKVYYKTGLEAAAFGSELGVSKRTIQYLISGEKAVSAKLSAKMREVFKGYF